MGSFGSGDWAFDHYMVNLAVVLSFLSFVLEIYVGGFGDFVDGFKYWKIVVLMRRLRLLCWWRWECICLRFWLVIWCIWHRVCYLWRWWRVGY
jgi:hypothetical protein